MPCCDPQVQQYVLSTHTHQAPSIRINYINRMKRHPIDILTAASAQGTSK